MSSTQLHMRSSYVMESGILDYGFGRCDGHHEMVDLRLRKKLGAGFVDSRYLSSGRSHTAVASSETTAGMSRPEVRGRLTPRFRTIQICPKDFPASLREAGRAVNRPSARQGPRKPDVRHE